MNKKASEIKPGDRVAFQSIKTRLRGRKDLVVEHRRVSSVQVSSTGKIQVSAQMIGMRWFDPDEEVEIIS